MSINPFKIRNAVLYAFALFFLIASLLLRIIFAYLSIEDVALTLKSAVSILTNGFIFDLGLVLCFSLFYSIYLLLLPQRFESDVARYHIPVLIYTVPNAAPARLDHVCSQIDLYPTLFFLLNWSHRSNTYGKNILEKNYALRTLIEAHQKLCYMKNDSLVVLSPTQKVETAIYNRPTNEQKRGKVSQPLINEAITKG